MSIKARLVMVLTIILIVFSGASGITLLTLNKQTPKLNSTQVAANRVAELSIPLLTTIKDLKMDVVQVQQWISDISATRGMDGLNDGFDEAKANADKFNEDLAKARELTNQLGLQSVNLALDEVEKAFPPYYETGVKMGETYVAEGPAGGNVMMGSFDAVAEKMGETLDALIAEVENATTQRLGELRALSAEVSEGNASIIKLNLMLGAVGLAVALVGAIYLFVVIKSSIEALLNDIGILSRQDYEAEKMLKADRSDEFGAVAVTIIDTCEKLLQVSKDEEKRKAQEQEAIEQRRKERMAMAEQFETSVGSVVEMVSAAASEMQDTAKGMSTTADMTSQQSSTVAAAAEEASTNVQTVASAAEELSSSISEISRQVAQSTQISSTAVAEVQGANEKVKGLANAANKIGEVVALITDIADQTNLLALNATIEAARAGDAGKGFAVVASEVKNLATQTAKATEEISAQIGGIQGATQEAVTAIESIGSIINQMNEIASTIAAAVEEQGAATQEIARNVEQAAQGTTEVSENISLVTQGAGETGQNANQILDSSGELTRQSEMLSKEVQKFLGTIRGA